MRIKRFVAPAAIASAGALLLAGCHAQRFQQDVTVTYLDTAVYSMEIEWIDVVNGPEKDGLEHIVGDITENCVDALNEDENEGTVGSWGTVGSSTDTTVSGHPRLVRDGSGDPTGTNPSEDTIACALDEWQDDPNVSNDNESLICDDASTADDCQDPDGGGMGTYKIMNAETDWYQAAFNTRAEMLTLLVLVRDYQTEGGGARSISDGGNGAPNCIAVRQDSGWTGANDGVTAEWRRTCQS